MMSAGVRIIMKLFKLDGSPPARAAMMVAELVGAPVQLVDVDLIGEKEHLKPDYLKKNPVHTIPMLEDGDLTLIDSHAIVQYLADKYGKDDGLYPKDLKQRALVNQKLFFDTAILFPRLRNITYAAIFEGVRKPTEKQLKEIDEAYGFVEAFLTNTTWLAGNRMTIADFSAVATVSSLNLILPLDAKKYPKTSAWLAAMGKETAYKILNAPGLAMFGGLIKQSLDL